MNKDKKTKVERIGLITKADDEKRLVYGWASVARDANGNVVIDSYNDTINESNLEDMAVEFMIKSQNSKQNHEGPSVGRVVQSIVFTKDVQESLGISVPTGWFIAVKVEDDSVWQKVKSGEYSAFSIGGYSRAN